MSQIDMEALRYPVGRFVAGPAPDPETRAQMISELERFPAELRAAVGGLNAAQLDTPYRPDGWTIRQVVHHLPDSHLNSYVRFKLAVTEEVPTIRTYDQAAWAELPEARSGDPEMSLRLLEALHARWTLFLSHIPESDWTRTLDHPEVGTLTLDDLLQLYVWHCRHHLGHITGVKDRKNWA